MSEIAGNLQRQAYEARRENRLADAIQHYEAAAALCRAEGDVPGLTHAERHMAEIQRELGRADLAEPCYHEALALYRGDPRTRPLDLANAVRGLAILKQDIGELDQAKLLWEEARNLYTTLDVREVLRKSVARLCEITAG